MKKMSEKCHICGNKFPYEISFKIEGKTICDVCAKVITMTFMNHFYK
jgi:CRISPR/Cas system-associated protein Cas10 (large subunit of type III CRISPR-Cas system)